MLRLFSFAFLLPIGVAFAYEESTVYVVKGFYVPETVPAFVVGFVLATLAWVPAKLATRRAEDDESTDREGYLIVALAWLVISTFAMVPFLVAKTFRTPLDAYFESLAGLTATAFSVLPIAADHVAPSINFWRVLLQWLGAIGFVILASVVVAKLTQGGLHPVQAETGGRATRRLRPKLAQTARTLFGIYSAISAIMFVALFLALWLRTGLAPHEAAFEGVLLTFGAISTGGFSAHEASVGHFADPVVEAITLITFVTGAISFVLLFGILRRGDWKGLGRDQEFRFTVASVVGLAVLVFVILVRDRWTGFGSAQLLTTLREATFNTASIATGTGFHSTDYSAWPSAALLVLLLAMFLGGQAGSTAGGIKGFRFLVLAHLVTRELRRLLHPRAVMPIRIGRRIIDEADMSRAIAFFFTFVLLWVTGTIALAVTEPLLAGPTDAAGAAAAALSNVGAGFGAAGPSGELEDFLPTSKIIMAALMWLGRLEIFTALLLFYPSSWKN